jgi:hypothetical protein
MKVRKYRDIASANGFGFLPIIFESCGYIHDDTCKFMKQLASVASEVKRIPVSTLYSYEAVIYCIATGHS